MQGYSGETGAAYLTQLLVITFLQFVNTATGIACLVALLNGLNERTTQNLGNLWKISTKTITGILLPSCPRWGSEGGRPPEPVTDSGVGWIRTCHRPARKGGRQGGDGTG
ncbi:MAG TPA: potassium-transporting ATPase subunit KdpA [Puia sp.]|nr:potassium-transporting ATPase subunit KdpA [Puia sp.]